jgi:hypothetical protein
LGTKDSFTHDHSTWQKKKITKETAETLRKTTGTEMKAYFILPDPPRHRNDEPWNPDKRFV